MSNPFPKLPRLDHVWDKCRPKQNVAKKEIVLLEVYERIVDAMHKQQTSITLHPVKDLQGIKFSDIQTWLKEYHGINSEVVEEHVYMGMAGDGVYPRLKVKW